MMVVAERSIADAVMPRKFAQRLSMAQRVNVSRDKLVRSKVPMVKRAVSAAMASLSISAMEC
jgi:hypothetical protein